MARVLFQDRTEAGRALASALAHMFPSPPVVAAVPRGGVVVASQVAERLAVPLTVLYALKLTTPLAPELAVGAMDEEGHAVIDYPLVAGLRLSDVEVEEAKRRVLAEIQRRRSLYGVPPLSEYLPAEAVLLIDDGLATGLTMEAAVAYARRHGAAEVVVAAPCASSRAAERFRLHADAFVSPIVDEAFASVGDYYVDFTPVSDEEVVAYLKRQAGQPAGSRGA